MKGLRSKTKALKYFSFCRVGKSAQLNAGIRSQKNRQAKLPPAVPGSQMGPGCQWPNCLQLTPVACRGTAACLSRPALSVPTRLPNKVLCLCLALGL